VAPYIDAKNLHDVTVIAGDRVKFDLKIFGEPTPEVVWHKEGVDEPLGSTSDRNLVINNTETNTKFVINNVKKSHAGKYVVTVTNASGTDSAKGEIKVLVIISYYIYLIAMGVAISSISSRVAKFSTNANGVASQTKVMSEHR